MNAQVLGISVDHLPCLKAWAETFGGIRYPLLSDFWPHGDIAQRYGVLRSDGFSERAIFLVDDFGVIRYIDVHDIGEQPDNRVLFAEIRKLRPGSVEEERPAVKADLPHGGVVMYCTRWCPECRRARNWLTDWGIPFTEVDVMTVPGADEQVKAWNDGNLTTPTFEIDGEVFAGFDPLRIQRLVKKRA